MLSCYKVLDLTNEKGFFCGRALADFGAQVIKIEKPGGDACRNIGPFYHDIPDPEKSLYWFAFNANKQGITLDYETADGREIFLKLVKQSDVVIESFPPGYMDKIGLGYAVLKSVNPGIILTSISGFGQKGPYRNYKDNDIAVWALSGYMYISGEPDRPPLMPSYAHGHLIGAMNGAVGTVIALTHRELTGEGQQVDAVTHQGLCAAISVETKVPWAMYKQITTRPGRDRTVINATDANLRIPLVWACRDVDLAFNFWIGPQFAKSNQSLVDWIRSDDIDPGILGRWDWEKETFLDRTVQEVLEIVAILKRFFKLHTKMELNLGALEKRIQLTPILTPRDQMDYPQLVYRDYWRQIEHPELHDTITYPGGFVKPGIGDCGIRFRAPLIGEHNKDIYIDRLGLTNADLLVLKQRRII
jgi:crotonobetainyl-CoA:carnitine CoA-transferase CaiB-like acyl-CoA transferase